jgi:hypothetical protein
MSEKKIFVSHVHEEAALGLEVKESLEDAFSHRVDVFVSSDSTSNPGGVEILPRIKQELSDPNSCMLISLISPQSLREPWISIELGAAWVLDRSVFPLCHLEQSIDGLGRPMKDFGGASLAIDDAGARLIGAAEKATGLRVPKGWSRSDFVARMRAASAKSKAATNKQPLPSSTTIKHSSRSPQEIMILQKLANAKNSGNEWIQEGALAVITGISRAELTHYLDVLGDGEMVIPMAAPDVEEMEYKLGPRGSQHLIEHGLMPK